MRLLLLNNNPAVSRLIKLSVDKVGYEMDEFEEYGLVPLKNYDLIMVDNECYDEEELKALCEHSDCGYTIYICREVLKSQTLPMYRLKSLSTYGFFNTFRKSKMLLRVQKSHEEEEEDHNILVEESKEETFDIDNIDTFGVDSASVDEMSSLKSYH